jgi:hypothetical protein
MHGLHEVDQNEMIIGFPSLRSVFVLKASPFAFSTVTAGTCANAAADIRTAANAAKYLFISIYF